MRNDRSLATPFNHAEPSSLDGQWISAAYQDQERKKMKVMLMMMTIMNRVKGPLSGLKLLAPRAAEGQSDGPAILFDLRPSSKKASFL
jgi:hypothetical protein